MVVVVFLSRKVARGPEIERFQASVVYLRV